MSVKKMQGIPAYLEYVGETGNLKNHSCRGCRNYAGGVCLAKNAVMSGYSDNNAKECSYFRNRYLNGKNDDDNKKVTITKAFKYKDSNNIDTIGFKAATSNNKRPKNVNYKRSFNKVIRNTDIVYVIDRTTSSCNKCMGNLLLTEVNLTVYSKVHPEDITIISVNGLICERCKSIFFNTEQYRKIKEAKINRAIKVACDTGFVWE